MYTLLTTFPDRGSANVGDKLIEHAVRKIVEAEKGPTEFHTVFREDPLEDHLDRVNASKAVLLPAFAVRDLPVYPGTYRLTEDLSDVEVPLIPIGSNYNVYPGDAVTRQTLDYSAETTEFLARVAAGVDQVSCREYHTCAVLERNGVENTLMTGDPAWFDPDLVGEELRRPETVDQVVFTPPLSPFYVEQAVDVIDLLAEQFPDADRIVSLHLADRDTADDDADPENSAALSEDVAAKNRRLRAHAAERGFETRETSGGLANIAFYEESDLHVGYECHAHAYFLRNRLPSVLVAEDARGVGFAYTLGTGGFRGFRRAQRSSEPVEKETTSGYCTTLSEYGLAPARTDLTGALRQFLAEEVANGFQRYAGMGAYLDAMYTERMRPFVRGLPGEN